MAKDTALSGLSTKHLSVFPGAKLLLRSQHTYTSQAAVEVEPLEPFGHLKGTIQSMNERGIGTLYGRWLIEGAPRVLLIDTSTGYRWLDEWKGDLWNTAGIPSPASDAETNEAIVFGYLVAWFLREVRISSD